MTYVEAVKLADAGFQRETASAWSWVRLEATDEDWDRAFAVARTVFPTVISRLGPEDERIVLGSENNSIPLLFNRSADQWRELGFEPTDRLVAAYQGGTLLWKGRNDAIEVRRMIEEEGKKVVALAHHGDDKDRLIVLRGKRLYSRQLFE